MDGIHRVQDRGEALAVTVPLPAKDYMAYSPEEEFVMYADTHSKAQPSAPSHL
jgi:hypothetical protein